MSIVEKFDVGCWTSTFPKRIVIDEYSRGEDFQSSLYLKIHIWNRSYHMSLTIIVNFNGDDYLQFQESLLVLKFKTIALIQHVPHFKYRGRFCTSSICGLYIVIV